MLDGVYRLSLDGKTWAFLRLYPDGFAQYCLGSADDSAGWLNRANSNAFSGTYALDNDAITVDMQSQVTGQTVSGRGIHKEGGLNLVMTDQFGQKNGGRFVKLTWTGAMAKIERECIRKAAEKTPADLQREKERNKETQEFSRNLQARRLEIQSSLRSRQEELAQAFARARKTKENYVLAAVLDNVGDTVECVDNSLRLFIIHNERARPYDYGFYSVEKDDSGEHLDIGDCLGECMWLNADGEVLFSDATEPAGTVLMFEWIVEAKGLKEIIFHYAGSECARFQLPQ
jgi:hypothetical protein